MRLQIRQNDGKYDLVDARGRIHRSVFKLDLAERLQKELADVPGVADDDDGGAEDIGDYRIEPARGAWAVVLGGVRIRRVKDRKTAARVARALAGEPEPAPPAEVAPEPEPEPEVNEAPPVPVSALLLTDRQIGALQDNGFRLVSDLDGFDRESLIALDGIGAKTADAILAALAAL